MKKMLMELIGTFFFILTIIMTGNAFAIAAMLMAWVYIGAHVSGGHYNPMVSLALYLRSKISRDSLMWYIVAQIAGGLAAFLMASFLNHHVMIPEPGANVSFIQAFMVETLLAFVLASIIVHITTCSKYKGNMEFGFIIGFTIPALAYLGGPITGGLFNPAISLGGALFSLIKGMPISWHHLIMYVGGAFLGGALAAYAFEFFYENER